MGVHIHIRCICCVLSVSLYNGRQGIGILIVVDLVGRSSLASCKQTTHCSSIIVRVSLHSVWVNLALLMSVVTLLLSKYIPSPVFVTI